MSIEGFLELKDPYQICGWAYAPEKPDEYLEIKFFQAGNLLGRATANVYRSDLEAASIGKGDHAFIYSLQSPADPLALSRITAIALLPGHAPVELSELDRLPEGHPVAKSWPAVSFEGSSCSDTQRPVFVLGSARSGTSAIVSGLLETTRYEGQEEGHFIEVLAPLYLHLNEFFDRKGDERLELRNTMIAHVSERFVREGINSVVLSAVSQLFPSGYWVDKTPSENMIHLAPQLAQIWPQARFIFMKRRGLENIASRLRKFPYDFAHNCREWSASMQAWLLVRDALAGRAMELDQMFLAEYPEDAAAAVSNLLQLDDSERVRLSRLLQNRRPQRTSVSMAETMNFGSTDWDVTNRQSFQDVCGPMMSAYYYSYTRSYYDGNLAEQGCKLL